MELSTKFDIFQRVLIREIKVVATVLEIKFDGLSIIYYLEYWWECEMRNVWLFERELEYSEKEKM